MGSEVHKKRAGRVFRQAGRSCAAGLLAAASLCSALTAPAAEQVADTAHGDGRGTAKLVFPDEAGAPSAKGARTVAEAYLRRSAARFGVADDLSGLSLAATRESLTGTHVRFQQEIGGVPVEGADLVVSVSRVSGRVYQAYNNTYPVRVPPTAHRKALIGPERALDVAWGHLRVHGRQLTPQRATLVYVPEKGGFRLVYRTQVSVEAPFGHWEHRIDALSGAVVSVRDRAVSRQGSRKELPDFAAYTGEVWPRGKTAEAYEAAQSAVPAVPELQATVVDGTAKVFDSDPRTTLANASLLNTSPSNTFVAAYVTRTLRGISLSSGTYSLSGPWVQIVNLESPNTSPSTTTTGNWTAARGNNAFNDVMTYFHIDQNQRYLQSLGYTGAAGIQYGPIRADSDGLDGADNSYYVSGDNWLSFGHGGVDDNEDADVILHEYGHAITYDIIPSWGGGDTGAIGEGFGDYWGASYSSTTVNGTTFHPEWAFSWDGHGADTWTGRFLNMTNLTYDATHTYTDHETIGGIANYSDQLWGTPLFQAFLTLRGMGVPREQIDRVVIESFFGVGSGPSMRDMANATVKAAQELYPSGPHASVFYDKFAKQLILTVFPLQDPALLYPAGGEAFTTGTVALVQWNRNNAPPAAYAKIEYTSKLSGGPVYFNDSVESGENGWLKTRSPSSVPLWAIVTTASHSPTHSWFASSDEADSDQFLYRTGLVVSNGACLAFWHAYDLEEGYDGAVVEISLNGGATWTDIGTNATQNGYNAVISSDFGNNIGGRPAFSGSSGGFVETVIPLSHYAGQTVGIRFRQADDSSVAASGWWIDDIRLYVGTPWTPLATTATNVSSYAWTLAGAPGTNYGVRVKLAGSNFSDSAWSASQAFTLKGVPGVAAWPSASPIIVGQTLASSVLSGGSATPAGSFAFVTPGLAPGVGTALQPVAFTPNDLANYTAETGAVSVTVAPLPEVGAFGVSSGTGAALQFAAVAGMQYRVRYSDDLLAPSSSWLWITPPADGWVTAVTNGPLQIVDPGATNSPARFYRLEERAP